MHQNKRKKKLQNQTPSKSLYRIDLSKWRRYVVLCERPLTIVVSYMPSIPGMEIELVDTDMPLINTDLEVDGTFPDSVEAFRSKVVKADCILFSSPEYNYSVSPVLKNAIDWASRAPNVMNGKPAAIMSVSTTFGGARAQYHLRQIGVYMDLHFVNKPEVFVDGYVSPRKFDKQGNLIDNKVKTEIKELLLALQELAVKLL